MFKKIGIAIIIASLFLIVFGATCLIMAIMA